jgi:hypothetical protein
MKLTRPVTVSCFMFQYRLPRARPNAPVPPMRASWYSGIRHEERAARRRQARSWGPKRARARERRAVMLSPCSLWACSTTACSSVTLLWGVETVNKVGERRDGPSIDRSIKRASE